MMLFGLGPIIAAVLIARYVPAPPPPMTRVPVRQRLRSLFSNGPLCVLALSASLLSATSSSWHVGAAVLCRGGCHRRRRAGTLAALQGVAASLGMIVSGWAHDDSSSAAMRRRA